MKNNYYKTPKARTKPKDPILFGLVAKAVRAGIEAVHKRQRSGQFIARHYKFPKLDRFHNGMPHLCIATGDEAPFDYRHALNSSDSPVNCDTMPDFIELVNYAKESQHSFLKARNDREMLVKHIADPEEKSRIADFLFRYDVNQLPLSVIERWLHSNNGNDTPDNEDILAWYLLLESSILDDESELVSDVIIPIIMVSFDFDELSFTLDGIDASLSRMTQGIQLARAPDDWTSSTHRVVVGCATHALELKNVSSLADLTTRMDGSILPIVESFFSSMRICLAAETGYAQLLLQPKGWARSFKASLPFIETVRTMKQYPAWFENFAWLSNEIRSFSEEEALSVVQTCNSLRSAKGDVSRRLNIAGRRISYCHLRDKLEDAVLDIGIALESLLSDSSRSAISDKLAQRVAALSRFYPSGDNAWLIYRKIKNFYHLRSEIVHGSSKEDSEALELFRYALYHTRNVIRVLTEKPRYLQEPGRIELELLLGKPSDLDPDKSSKS